MLGQTKKWMQTINEGSSIYKPKRRGNGDHNFAFFPERVPENATLYKGYDNLASFAHTRRNTKSDADNIDRENNV
jgi:hypothetical protein